MDLVKETIIKISTPKRASLDINYLLNVGSMFHFLTGLSVALFFTFCIHYLPLMFTFGVLVSFTISLYVMMQYLPHIRHINIKMLPSLNNISFTNTHFITKDTMKCCGSSSDLCGWVYGVTSPYGLHSTDSIQQEMHACIRSPNLILSIPSPRLEHSILNSRIQLGRDMVEYKRVINLNYANISRIPATGNIWSPKFPIVISYKSDASSFENVPQWKMWEKRRQSDIEFDTAMPPWHGFSRKQVSSWANGTGFFSLFQCKERKSTMNYIRKSYRKPNHIFLCFLTGPDKEFWFNNLQNAVKQKPVNPPMWQMIRPLIRYKNPSKIRRHSKREVDNDYENFVRFFSQFMPFDWVMYKNKSVPLNVQHIHCEPHLLWLNGFIARFWWSFVQQDIYSNEIMAKIHRKMKKLRKPSYIESIDIKSVCMGENTPVISEIDHPVLDTMGLWFDVDFEYHGGLSSTIVVKVDITKLRDRRSVNVDNSTEIAIGELSPNKMRTMSSLLSPQASSMGRPVNVPSVTDSPLVKSSSFITTQTVNTASVMTLNQRIKRNMTHFKRRRLPDINTKRKSSLLIRSIKLPSGTNIDTLADDLQTNRNNRSKRRRNTVKEFMDTNMLQKKYSANEEYEYDEDDDDDDFDDDFDDEDNGIKQESDIKLEGKAHNCFEKSLRDIRNIFSGPKYHSQLKRNSSQCQRSIKSVLNKIKQHRYFRKAGNITCFKRGLQYFGTKRILIDLHLHKLSGTLTILYPTPASDGVWFGFRPHPELNLTILPKIGQRKLNFNVMLDWIQKKIMSELKKVFILPNMENVQLPS